MLLCLQHEIAHHDVEVILIPLIVQFWYTVGVTQGLINLPLIRRPTGGAAFACLVFKL